MAHSHHHHMHRHVQNEKRFNGPPSSASQTMVESASRVLMARADSTCTSDSQPGCTKPTQTPTLVIALAIIIPVVGLAIVLVFLNFRHKRKLREEDAKDKHNTGDWGMEGASRAGKKGGPEMRVSEKEIAGSHDRGLSLETGSPYILPAGLHGSTESFHSLSRSQHDPHDPYGPVNFLKHDGHSVRSSSRGRADNGSMYTASSAGTRKEGLQAGLLQNAQRMSTSYPMRGESLSSPDGSRSPDSAAIPLSPLNPRYDVEPFPAHPAPVASPTEFNKGYAAFKPSNVPTISIPDAAVTEKQVNKSPVQTTPDLSSLPRIQSQQAVVLENTAANTNSILSTSSYGDGFQITPPSPTIVAPKPRYSTGPQNLGLGVDDSAKANNRLSMSLRPMPPSTSDDPTENPEERANRIRSFYKEYFDDSKPEPVGGHTYTDYVEDYGSEYQDGAVFDPRTGNFVVAQPNAPFAEPITRRAMTPPPRAPPRFRSNTGTASGGPHMSNGSMASSQYPPPRGMSSMSGRLPPPKKPLPPPSALSSLPTPAKLTENSMVFDAADFAPPVSFRERQNGIRPDSPLGSPRPYSPAVRPHTPLVGSYDDLAVLPSPHLMRKSGTFTALDFAPPSRIRDPNSSGASDSGSIRSNRSGMTPAGQFAVRNGVNRVSRIPKELLGTTDDFAQQLRPKMSLVTSA